MAFGGLSMSISSPVRHVKRTMAKVQKDLAFVEASALTRTAKDVQKAMPALMEREIDKPTPFTKKAFAVRPATKARRVARIFIKDRQADYLRRIIAGGTRRPKRTAIVVPVKARRNRYGNLSRGYLQKQLAKPNVFSGRVNGVGGIWQRMRSGRMKLLVAFEPKAEYRKTFDPGRTIYRIARRRFPYHFRRQFNQTFRRLR